MKPEKLTVLKKDLNGLAAQQLIEICLRLAKYKKDNKELLSFLLYHSADPLAYAEEVKTFLQPDFKALPRNYYQMNKSLRKILRLLNRYAKYTASKQAELELLLWFCRNYIAYSDTHTHHKPLQLVFTRQVEKIRQIIAKLHEDLQFDYSQEVETLLTEAEARLSWFSK